MIFALSVCHQKQFIFLSLFPFPFSLYLFNFRKSASNKDNYILLHCIIQIKGRWVAYCSILCLLWALIVSFVRLFSLFPLQYFLRFIFILFDFCFAVIKKFKFFFQAGIKRITKQNCNQLKTKTCFYETIVMQIFLNISELIYTRSLRFQSPSYKIY